MLTPEAVQTLMRICLADEGAKDPLIVEGIIRKFAFDAKTVEENKDQIVNLLNELPAPFMLREGGGWSFLMAANDKHGNQWGEHQAIEELMCLGMAAGKVKYVFEERELWEAFPGGMPYFVVMP